MNKTKQITPELKYRVWDKVCKRWLDPTQITMTPTGAIVYAGVWLVPPEIEISLFTGLKDRNGLEIWSGDIISAGFHNRVVSWFDYGWYAERNGLFTNIYTDTTEVIGNIYEHQHLLNETRPTV